jgi:hypothetical protein
MIADPVAGGQMMGFPQDQTITIMSDSQSALQAIANPSNKSGQHIVHSILEATEALIAHNVRLRLQWVPGHSDNPGNDAADRMAKATVGPVESHRFRHLASRQKRCNEDRIVTEWENAWKSSEKGGHLRQIDTMLPSSRTRRLCDSLPRNRTYLLTQLRTGHSWLAAHAKLHRLRDDDKCQCGAKETVVHVLVDCPRLKNLRQQLRWKIGEAFNDISAMLGGKGRTRQGQVRVETFIMFSMLYLILRRHLRDFEVACPYKRDQKFQGKEFITGLDEALNSSGSNGKIVVVM